MQIPHMAAHLNALARPMRRNSQTDWFTGSPTTRRNLRINFCPTTLRMDRSPSKKTCLTTLPKSRSSKRSPRAKLGANNNRPLSPNMCLTLRMSRYIRMKGKSAVQRAGETTTLLTFTTDILLTRTGQSERVTAVARYSLRCAPVKRRKTRCGRASLFKGLTIEGAAKHWAETAPPAIQRKYADALAKAAGVPPNTPVSKLTQDQLDRLKQAQKGQEGFVPGITERKPHSP